MIVAFLLPHDLFFLAIPVSLKIMQACWLYSIYFWTMLYYVVCLLFLVLSWRFSLWHRKSAFFGNTARNISQSNGCTGKPWDFAVWTVILLRRMACQVSQLLYSMTSLVNNHFLPLISWACNYFCRQSLPAECTIDAKHHMKFIISRLFPNRDRLPTHGNGTKHQNLFENEQASCQCQPTTTCWHKLLVK